MAVDEWLACTHPHARTDGWMDGWIHPRGNGKLLATGTVPPFHHHHHSHVGGGGEQPVATHTSFGSLGQRHMDVVVTVHADTFVRPRTSTPLQAHPRRARGQQAAPAARCEARSRPHGAADVAHNTCDAPNLVHTTPRSRRRTCAPATHRTCASTLPLHLRATRRLRGDVRTWRGTQTRTCIRSAPTRAGWKEVDAVRGARGDGSCDANRAKRRPRASWNRPSTRCCNV